jgi:hypothetical protein
MATVVGKDEPEEHDYPAAAAHLTLITDPNHRSPILLIRGNMTTRTPARIADGYHRVCARYQVDENTDIPCRITDA